MEDLVSWLSHSGEGPEECVLHVVLVKAHIADQFTSLDRVPGAANDKWGPARVSNLLKSLDVLLNVSDPMEVDLLLDLLGLICFSDLALSDTVLVLLDLSLGEEWVDEL